MINSERKPRLYSGQFRHSKILIFSVFLIFVIISLNKTMAVDFGMGPAYVFLEGNQGELLCQNISIFCEECGEKLILNDKWMENNNLEDKLENYKLRASEKGVESYYPESLLAKNQNQIVCFKSLKKGIYRGILMLQPEKGVFGVVIKIKLVVGEENSIQNKRSFLTSNAILNSNERNGLFWIVLLQNFVLMICLMALLKVFKIQKRNAIKYTY